MDKSLRNSLTTRTRKHKRGQSQLKYIGQHPPADVDGELNSANNTHREDLRP